jgi:hypothetical protein
MGRPAPGTELVIVADRSGVDRTAIDAQLDACLTGSAMITDPAP